MSQARSGTGVRHPDEVLRRLPALEERAFFGLSFELTLPASVCIGTPLLHAQVAKAAHGMSR